MDDGDCMACTCVESGTNADSDDAWNVAAVVADAAGCWCTCVGCDVANGCDVTAWAACGAWKSRNNCVKCEYKERNFLRCFVTTS